MMSARSSARSAARQPASNSRPIRSAVSFRCALMPACSLDRLSPVVLLLTVPLAMLGAVPDDVASKDACLAYLYHLAWEAVGQALGPVAVVGKGLLASIVRQWLDLDEHPHLVEAKALSVIVTSNRWERWREALEAASESATILLLAFPGRNEGLPPFNPLASEYLYDKQLTIRAVGKASHSTIRYNIAWILEEMSAKRLDCNALTGEPISANQLGWAYAELDARRSDKPTYVMEW